MFSRLPSKTTTCRWLHRSGASTAVARHRYASCLLQNCLNRLEGKSVDFFQCYATTTIRQEGSISISATSDHDMFPIFRELLFRICGFKEKEDKTPSRVKLSTLDDLKRQFCKGYPKLPALKLSEAIKEDGDHYFCARILILSALLRHGGPPIRNEDDGTGAVVAIEKHLSMDEIVQLQQSCTPRYEKFFQRLLEHDSSLAVPFLMYLREDTLKLLGAKYYYIGGLDDEKQRLDTEDMVKNLKLLDNHLRHLLLAWFNPGMLETRRITFENTSAAIIENVALKEAVHPMKSLDDLRRRLGPKRRVFALFHPFMPNQPLVLLHVKLQIQTTTVPSSMKQVMVDPLISQYTDALVATFYSISNTQVGLTKGVGLGALLIKNAVQQLKAEFRSLNLFFTLSPIPGFRAWMEKHIIPRDDNTPWSDQLSSLQDWLGPDLIRVLTESTTEKAISSPTISYEEVFRRLSKDAKTTLEEYGNDLETILSQLTARYLVVVKHPKSGGPVDKVAGFHLGNGAEVYRINFYADPSQLGLNKSFGMMVNYQYNLDNILENKQKFESEKRIEYSKAILGLL